MTDKKVGDRVRSTRINETPVTVIEGTIIDIDGREMADGGFIPECALVKQDDGKTEWWSL